MPHSSLRIPDSPALRHDNGYSPALAGALTQAYRFLKPTPSHPADYLQALTTLAPHLLRRMSPHQRMRVCYALGMVYLGLDDFPQAVALLDDAIETADAVRDTTAFAELAALAGAAKTTLLQYTAGAAYYADAVRALQSLRAAGHIVDDGILTSTLLNLSANRFTLGDYARCAGHLTESRQILNQSPITTDTPLYHASINWMTALLHRWDGRLESALRLALSAAHTYEQSDAILNTGRVRMVVAAIALDLAEAHATTPADDRHHAYLHLARPAIQRATLLAAQANDPNGIQQARLLDIRYSRARGYHATGISFVEDMLRASAGTGDPAVLAQTHMAMGDEWVVRGEREYALISYRNAIRVCEEFELNALAALAWRALWRTTSFG